MNSNHINVTLRDPDRYPEKLKLILDLITINEVPKVVGSYAYISHKYPSDVDVFERVTLTVSKNEAAKTYATHFRNIMQKLLILSSDIYINDFKCGSYNGLPLRWTARQIIDNVYILPDGVKILLKNAILQEEIIKLDIIAYIMGKFQSVEVFYNLRYIDNNIEKDFYPLGSYVKSLLNDIFKYSTKEYYNPLKLAKRLWNMSRVTDCSDLLKKLDPLMQSNAASLNQIKSDIEIIKDLIINMKDVLNNSKPLALQVELNRTIKYNENINKIHLQILHFYKRLSNHMESYNIKNIENIFNIIFDEWVYYSIYAKLNINLIFEKLGIIINLIKTQIIKESEEYLQLVLDTEAVCKINYNKYINI